MKALTKLIIAVSLFISFGCNEVPTTEPEAGIQKSCDPIIKEVINLCCNVQDPIMGACQVIGEVTYQHEIMDPQEKLSGISLVRVQLEMNAELCDRYGMVHLPWGIVGSSEDFVYVSEDGIYILQKAYPICHRNECVLVVQYLVTTEGVGIPNMWIDLID